MPPRCGLGTLARSRTYAHEAQQGEGGGPSRLVTPTQAHADERTGRSAGCARYAGAHRYARATLRNEVTERVTGAYALALSRLDELDHIPPSLRNANRNVKHCFTGNDETDVN